MVDDREPSRGGAEDPTVGRGEGRLALFGGAVGLGGTLVCSLSMIAAAVGLFAAAAQGGMAGMGSGHQSGADAVHNPGWLDAILRFGPGILIVSVLLVAASVALRRRWAALPAIGGGLILYVGMYAQPNLALMYAAIAVGTVLLLAAYVISVRPPRTESVDGLVR